MADNGSAQEKAMSWTDERVDLLRKLWLEGLSASRIAAELSGGVTRNAVIGKVHRLGMSGRVKAPAVPLPAARRSDKPDVDADRQAPQRAAMPVRGNLAMVLQERPMAAPQTFRASGDNVVPMAQHVTIMELRESMCRWPVGDPSSTEFRYCGGKAPIGDGPYCTLHSRMAYQPTQDRRARKIA